MSRHVVFGAGQIGTHVAGQLLEAGKDVVVVSRNGRSVARGARAITADLTDAQAAASASQGAQVIYFVEGLPAAATSAKARTRTDMTNELPDAHRRGDLDVTIGHLPITETLTTRELIDAVYKCAGHPTRLAAAGRTALNVVGLFKPELKELRHTLDQFTEPWVVDDTKFRTIFGDLSTPPWSAIEATA
jgi:NAD(P)-dependent dehydrogenase (short-subunit alcohol dehydrogenase family)